MEHRLNTLREINRWLGWGDPEGGVWFVGVEEGAEFTPAKIAAMLGRRYEPVAEKRQRRSPVALRTAKIVCQLSGIDDVREYAQARMGWPGSKVFNANLFPLGKSSTSAWPSKYGRLIGITREEYRACREELYAERATLFRELKQKHRPQAVVCFGKSCWERFEEVFVKAPARRIQPDRRCDIFVCESDKVILTPHFSYGTWMPNVAVDCVVYILRRWRVRLPG